MSSFSNPLKDDLNLLSGTILGKSLIHGRLGYIQYIQQLWKSDLSSPESTWSILETKSLSPLASSPVLICVHHSNEDLDTALSLTFNDQSTGTGLEEGGSSFFDLTGFGDSSLSLWVWAALKNFSMKSNWDFSSSSSIRRSLVIGPFSVAFSTLMCGTSPSVYL